MAMSDIANIYFIHVNSGITVEYHQNAHTRVTAPPPPIIHIWNA